MEFVSTNGTHIMMILQSLKSFQFLQAVDTHKLDRVTAN